MDEIISNIINNFDWAYMLSVNVLTYIINELIASINKNKVPTYNKKLITIGTSIILAIVYYFIDEDISLRILLNSAILAPVAWDYIFKPILNKFGVDYKNNLNLNNN